MSDVSRQALPRSGWMKWLVISVAANLFLCGLLIGSWISGPWRGGPPPRPPFQMMVREAAGKVSPEGLQKLSELADELENRFRNDISKAGYLRQRIQAELVREPFDVAAFGKALDDLNTAFAANHGAASKRFAEVIASLSPHDRKQLVNVRFP